MSEAYGRKVRKLFPAQTDLAKRLLLIFLSVVILQVYFATEEEPGLSSTALDSPSDLPWYGAALIPTASDRAETHCILHLVAGRLWKPPNSQRSPTRDSSSQEQSHNLQSKIRSQFAERHQILTENEQRVLMDIQEEEKKILNAMEKNLREIKENLNSIQEEIFKLQQQMDHKDSVVFQKEEAGLSGGRVRDEAKPLSVVDVALPIDKFHCPVSLNTAFKETFDYFKQGKAYTFSIVLVPDTFK
ncbi:uncharacterized protein LOC144602514 [Rhinoraja longicauda]